MLRLRKIHKISILFVTSLGLIIALLLTARAEDEVFMEAEQVNYDHESGVVSAAGRVEVIRDETVLFADKITYDQNTDLVYAEGNVAVSGPDGEVAFSDRFVLQNDFKQGVVEYFSARLSDGSLIAAAEAKRINENRIEMEKAVYSPCPICRGEDDPLWQVKAEKVIMDNDDQMIQYEDAYLEVYGVPVFYAPYFAHPTPDAERKSGFLPPELSSDSNLGQTLKVPYYWNISPDMDVTFEPIITSKEGLVAAGEFRHKTNYGDYKFYLSATRPRGFDELADSEEGESSFRGHIKGEGLFNITENWDAGFDGELATDDTYLRRYNYSSQDLLTSRIFAERIKERNYSTVQLVSFQGLLEEDDNDQIPMALPYTKNHFETKRGIIPGYESSYGWGSFDALAVNREDGQDNQRASASAGVTIPYTTASGHLFEVDASLRADQFNVDDNSNSSIDGSESRFIPEVSAGWSYPMINDLGQNGQILLEPVAKIIVAPSDNFNSGVPNEDSQDVEFSDLNVFSKNRFRGIDRVESGTRVHYGIRGGYYVDDINASYSIGQNYNFEEPEGVPTNSGFDDNMSDIVGRVSVGLYNTLDFAYRFRYDAEDFSSRRHEVDATVDYYPVKFNINYLNLDFDFTDPTDNREEITGNAAFNVTKEWSLLMSGRRNIDDGSNVEAAAGIRYEGDCLDVTASVSKDFITDRDVKAGTSFGLKVGLKNLGEL